MRADKYIYAKLTGNSAVAAFAGTGVWPVIVPQGEAYPAIVFSAVYTPADDSKNSTPGHHNCNLTIRCWHEKYDEAVNMDVAVYNALIAADNDGAGDMAGGITIPVIEWINSVDGIEDGNSAPGGKPYFMRESTWFLRERVI